MAGDEQALPVERQETTVSVLEAARRLGKSADAIRSALRRRTLAGWRDNQGEWRIPVAELPAAPELPEQEPGPVLDLLRQELDRLHTELRQARDAAEAWRQQADDRQATVAELRERLARAEAEREAARAVAIADVATAQAEASAKDQVIAELKAMLAVERERADRPWWRRLIGL